MLLLVHHRKLEVKSQRVSKTNTKELNHSNTSVSLGHKLLGRKEFNAVIPANTPHPKNIAINQFTSF